MYFRFCIPFVLKLKYGILYMHSVASNLSLVFDTHPSFILGISCLKNSPFDGWTFLIAPYLNISFTSTFNDSSTSRLTLGWEGVFDWKGFGWNGILHPFTMFKNLGSWVTFIQAPTKCFNLPANGTSEILFDKNNLFIKGETFLIPTELVFLDLNSCWRRLAVE